MENRVEREISLSNLFWKVLLGWRRWMALGVIFAILIGVFDYAKSFVAYNNAVKQQEAVQQGETPEAVVLTPEEMESVKQVKDLQKTIDKLQEYMEQSILMNLNSYEEQVLVLQYYVDSDYTFNYMQENEKDYTDEVLAAYCNYASSGGMAVELCNQINLDISSEYLSELIKSNRDADTFQICVIYNDSEMLEQMSSVIQTVVEEQKADIAKEIGSHELRLLSAEIVPEIDTGLASIQKSQKDILYSYQTQLTNLKATLTEVQLSVLESAIQQGESTEEVNQADTMATAVRPSFRVKMLILGFVIGVFLACIWIVLEVLFGSRIQESSELPSLYGVRLIGELNGEDKKKKFLGCIDSFILKQKNRNKKQLTREQQIKMISSNIEIACKKVGITTLYLTGSEIEKWDPQWLVEIKGFLNTVGIRIDSGENISYDAKSLKNMAETGYVVFLEQVGESLYSEVEREVRIARENNVEIMGSIVVIS